MPEKTMRYLYYGLVAFAAACAKEEFTAPSPPAQQLPSVTWIRLSGPTALEIGGTGNIEVVLRDADGERVVRDVEFGSSNPKIATVSPLGVVTGVSPGPVVITATIENKSAILSLQVVSQQKCTDTRRPDWQLACRVTETYDLVNVNEEKLPVHSPWGVGDWDYDADAGTWNLVSWRLLLYSDGTYTGIVTHRAASGTTDLGTASGAYTRQSGSLVFTTFGQRGTFGGSISGNELHLVSGTTKFVFVLAPM